MNTDVFDGLSCRPLSKNDKLVCPRCSTVTVRERYHNHTSYKIDNPVFLVARINNKTSERFLGCPNFPKCRYSHKKSKQYKLFDVDNHWETIE